MAKHRARLFNMKASSDFSHELLPSEISQLKKVALYLLDAKMTGFFQKHELLKRQNDVYLL